MTSIYEIVPVDQLTGYERNARKHSRRQISRLVEAIKEFGFTNPLLIDEENTIIAGHGRHEAARKMGMVELPVIRIKGLTKAEKAALVIADNQIAENAGWDMKLVEAELSLLADDGFDVTLTGFDFDWYGDEDDPYDTKALSGNMSKKFLAAPFTVLDAASDQWRERREAWNYEGDTDPVLCELMVAWFAPPGGTVSSNSEAVTAVAAALGREDGGNADLVVVTGTPTQKALKAATAALRSDRFMIAMGTDFRALRAAFDEAGIKPYNEAVYVADPDGPAGEDMLILQAIKGDAKKASKDLGPPDIEKPEALDAFML